MHERVDKLSMPITVNHQIFSDNSWQGIYMSSQKYMTLSTSEMHFSPLPRLDFLKWLHILSSSSVSKFLSLSPQICRGTVVITTLGCDTGDVTQCRCGFWKYCNKQREQYFDIVTPEHTFLLGHPLAAWRALVCNPVWARGHISSHVSRAECPGTPPSGQTGTCDGARVSESGQQLCHTRPSRPRKQICNSSTLAEKVALDLLIDVDSR